MPVHPEQQEPGQCYFCGSKDLFLPGVGISLSMAGWDYEFCHKCLAGMTAEQFWQKIFEGLEYDWPPKRIKGTE